MWDLIVSVPDHCLSFYFRPIKKCRKSNVSEWNRFKNYRVALCLILQFTANHLCSRESLNTIDSYCYITVQKVKPVYQQMILSPKFGVEAIATISHFSTYVYKGSFFSQTIRDWNALPDSLISSAEIADDCNAK